MRHLLRVKRPWGIGDAAVSCPWLCHDIVLSQLYLCLWFQFVCNKFYAPCIILHAPMHSLCSTISYTLWWSFSTEKILRKSLAWELVALFFPSLLQMALFLLNTFHSPITSIFSYTSLQIKKKINNEDVFHAFLEAKSCQLSFHLWQS